MYKTSRHQFHAGELATVDELATDQFLGSVRVRSGTNVYGEEGKMSKPADFYSCEVFMANLGPKLFARYLLVML